MKHSVTNVELFTVL